MDTADKYILRIYEEKSFSQAAKSLFISQPSLSAAVARKEEEIGFRVFDRSTKPITLTPQGHIYLDMLEEITASEKNMRARVQNLSEGALTSITVGGSSAVSYYLIPAVCGAFYRRYPKIPVTVDLGNFGAVSALTERISHFEKLERGDLDIIFGYEYDADKHVARKICSERLVVAMHRDLLTKELAPYALTRDELLSGNCAQSKEIKAKNLFSAVPFLDFAKSTNTGRYMRELLGTYRTSLHQISYARHSVVHFNMMCAGIGAMLTSDRIAALSNPDPQSILYFAFDKSSSERNIFAITKKNAVRCEAVRPFIQLAEDICRNNATVERYTNG